MWVEFSGSQMVGIEDKDSLINIVFKSLVLQIQLKGMKEANKL